MTISPEGIRYYLDERNLTDWRELKSLRRYELMGILRDTIQEQGLDPECINWKTKPWLHQLTVFVAGALEGNFFMSLDMGTGKTKIFLDWYRFNLVAGRIKKRALVIVPDELNIEGWIDDARVHSEYSVTPLVGSTAQKWDSLQESPERSIAMVTYIGLMHMVTENTSKKKGKEVNKGSGGKKKKRKLEVSQKHINRMLSLVDCVMADETHEIRNYQSLPALVCQVLSNRVPVRYGGTGTPFGRDPMDLWSQFHFIDHGETLGQLGLFREAFFNSKAGWGGHKKWVFDTRMEEDLHRLLANRSLRYEDTECSDLPPIVSRQVRLPFTKEAYSFYKPAKVKMELLARGKEEDNDVESSFSKLRQVCSGFLYVNVEGDRIANRFTTSPKLDALVSLVLSIPNKKVLVFVEFEESRAMVSERLTKEGVRHVVVEKTVDNYSKIAAVRKFKQDLDTQVLVSHWKSAGVGGNFQMAQYVLFYEGPVSPIYRKQCIKRVQRPGQQEDKVFIYDFVTVNSVEEKILKFIEEGEDLFAGIISGKATVDNNRTPLLGLEFEDV